MEKEEIQEKLKELSSVLKKELKKLRIKREKQQIELVESSSWEIFRHWADTLLARRDDIQRGSLSAILEEVHSGEIVEIALNPKCNVDKNAELYYKKARRGQRSEEICREKCEETDGELASVQEFIDRLNDFTQNGIDGRENAAIAFVLDVEKGDFTPKASSGNGSKGKPEKPLPFRHYEIEGFHIYAGKTSSDNDELSVRFAKPSDIWFHAVGYAGSHVIIRRPNGAPMPPQKIIDIAGGIAVFFSKAKNCSYAEVHMTEARFVRKPRKAPAGLVTADRCKTLRMSPVDPQKLFR